MREAMREMAVAALRCPSCARRTVAQVLAEGLPLASQVSDETHWTVKQLPRSSSGRRGVCGACVHGWALLSASLERSLPYSYRRSGYPRAGSGGSPRTKALRGSKRSGMATGGGGMDGTVRPRRSLLCLCRARALFLPVQLSCNNRRAALGWGRFKRSRLRQPACPVNKS